jgi:hypothetical protein
MLAFVTVFFVVVGSLMVMTLIRSDLPPAGRITGSAFASALVVTVLSFWAIVRSYRRAGEPVDWRSISRETDAGRAFWRARRISMTLSWLAAAMFAGFVALALSGSLGGHSPLWDRP